MRWRFGSALSALTHGTVTSLARPHHDVRDWRCRVASRRRRIGPTRLLQPPAAARHKRSSRGQGTTQVLRLIDTLITDLEATPRIVWPRRRGLPRSTNRVYVGFGPEKYHVDGHGARTCKQSKAIDRPACARRQDSPCVCMRGPRALTSQQVTLAWTQKKHKSF
jgi:hypothetical protein